MKVWIPIFILFLAVTGLCIWDSIYTYKIFNYLEKESEAIYSTLLTGNIADDDIKDKINSLNDFWTDKMDVLCISISRKDLQPVSDYLQYLCASATNESQDDAIVYSRLLSYNLNGLSEHCGISGLNLL